MKEKIIKIDDSRPNVEGKTIKQIFTEDDDELSLYMVFTDGTFEIIMCDPNYDVELDEPKFYSAEPTLWNKLKLGIITLDEYWAEKHEEEKEIAKENIETYKRRYPELFT